SIRFRRRGTALVYEQPLLPAVGHLATRWRCSRTPQHKRDHFFERHRCSSEPGWIRRISIRGRGDGKRSETVWARSAKDLNSRKGRLCFLSAPTYARRQL